MTLKDAQDYVDEFIKKSSKGYWDPLSSLARLMEEVGELSRELNHKYGEKIKKDKEIHGNIEDEMSDILFTLLCLANYEKVNLTKGLENVIKKYSSRDKNRWNLKENKKDS